MNVHPRDSDDLLTAAERFSEDNAELISVARQLGTDERKVLLLLARRLLKGQATYGLLDVRSDPRDWRKERAEELQDALIYGAIVEVVRTVSDVAQGPRMGVHDRSVRGSH
jgi:hypothetical protein